MFGHIEQILFYHLLFTLDTVPEPFSPSLHVYELYLI